MLCWNFDIEHPTDSQMQSLRDLITDIRVEYWSLKVSEHWHNDGEHTKCAWENFHLEDIYPKWQDNTRKTVAIVPETKDLPPPPPLPPEPKSWETIFFDEITAYYNCLPWQERYYQWSYQAEKSMNWCGAFAMWWYGKEEHKYTHGACWYKRPFGTILEIEWWGQVTCVDRWGAIDNNDIDIWYGIWQDAVDNISEQRWEKFKQHPTSAQVKVIYIPK